MKNTFNLHTQIQNWIDQKKLIQIHQDEDTAVFNVAYILKFENDFLTFVTVAVDGCFGKIIICHIDDVQLFKTDSIYLSEFSKKVDSEAIYQQAITNIAAIQKFTFIDILTNLQNKKTLITIAYGSGEEFTGRVINIDKSTLVIDEYGSEFDRCFARTYLKMSNVARIYLASNDIKTITRSLLDKNI